MRPKVHLLFFVVLLLLGFIFISCAPPMVNGKMFPKVFLILSENDNDVVCFSVPPAIIVLSVGDLLVAAISVEITDSSDISSRSNVPVEVAKSWPCSTGVDSLASLLSLPSSPLFALLRSSDSLFQPFCLKPSPLCRSGIV